MHSELILNKMASMDLVIPCLKILQLPREIFSVTLAGMYIGALHATCVNTLQIGRTPFVNPTHHREYESF